MRLPRPSCHALRVIFLGASHHALASPRAFCYAFRTRSYRVLSHNRDLLHLIRGPMLGLLSVPHPERRSIRASCNHVLLAEPSLRRCFHPLPIVWVRRHTYETDVAARKPRSENARGLTTVGEAWDYMEQVHHAYH